MPNDVADNVDVVIYICVAVVVCVGCVVGGNVGIVAVCCGSYDDGCRCGVGNRTTRCNI